MPCELKIHIDLGHQSMNTVFYLTYKIILSALPEHSICTVKTGRQATSFCPNILLQVWTVAHLLEHLQKCPTFHEILWQIYKVQFSYAMIPNFS